MILVNTDYITNKEIVEMLGLVKASTVQTKHIGKDIMASLRGLVGGEINEYTDMMDNARKIALDKLSKEASSLGADGVINIRFSTSAIMEGASEILAYGTAVKIK
ncbi:MAG: YbjQ family protein [Acidaminobacteraceae bacterium]